MSKLTKGKPVAEEIRHTIKVEWFRKMTWKERIAILFGCNFVVQVAIHCRHNPGAMQPFFIGRVSKEVDHKEHMRVIADEVLEAKKPKYEVVSSPKADPTKS